MSEHCPHCGGVLETHKKVRSLPDHRRFFALIRAAFEQWPLNHEFQPLSAEHLRAWLLCKVRYHQIEMIDVGTDIFDGLDADTKALVDFVVRSAVHRSIEAATRESGFAFDKPYGSGIAIFRPKSIDFESMDQKDFGELRQAVEEVIESIIGVDAEKLLRETERAA